jgi:hypothetical protein
MDDLQGRTSEGKESMKDDCFWIISHSDRIDFESATILEMTLSIHG